MRIAAKPALHYAVDPSDGMPQADAAPPADNPAKTLIDRAAAESVGAEVGSFNQTCSPGIASLATSRMQERPGLGGFGAASWGTQVGAL